VTTSEVVVGVFGREQLSDGLVAIHQAGLGPMARVLDPARGDLDAQLRRTGYEVPVSFAEGDAGIALLFITAPGRAERAATTMTQAGARAVYQARRAGSAMVPADPIPPEAVALDARDAPPPAALEG
jgi:hypothetical protein